MDTYNSELLEALRVLGDVVTTSVDTKPDMAAHTFDMAATAALIKAHQFCQEAVRTPQKRSFFLLASLRGICEDYILLRFIDEQAKSSKNRIVFLRLMVETHESTAAQWNFFKVYHPGQKLYYEDNVAPELEQFRDEIKSLLSGHPIKGNATMPPVYHMAEAIGLLSLYQYVYHAASQFVHFSPRLLLRMGWGGPPTFTFSAENFCDYYSHFAMFYGVFLFCAMLDWMSGINVKLVPNLTSPAVGVLKNYIQKTSRWPELVTFEEMNVGALSRVLFFKSPDEIR